MGSCLLSVFDVTPFHAAPFHATSFHVTSKTGRTPIYCAVTGGRTEMVSLLLSRGARDLNTKVGETEYRLCTVYFQIIRFFFVKSVCLCLSTFVSVFGWVCMRVDACMHAAIAIDTGLTQTNAIG
jgi:hypothetical protein